MKLVKLEGLLFPNNEFMCCGKSIFLTDEEIEKYIEEKHSEKQKGGQKTNGN